MKVKVEIETTDLFRFTSSAREDSKIVEELLDSLNDEPLIQAVINRGLVEDLFDCLSAKEQDNIIGKYANDFGYTKIEE